MAVTMVDVIRCPRCETDKPASEFWKNAKRKNGRQVYCKVCIYAYRGENPNVNVSARRWYHTKGKYRKAAARYGLTLDEYMALIETSTCAICNKKPTRETLDGHVVLPHVDHDHSTGKVRGILCQNCNVGLGMFAEDLQVMRRAIRYLEGHK